MTDTHRDVAERLAERLYRKQQFPSGITTVCRVCNKGVFMNGHEEDCPVPEIEGFLLPGPPASEEPTTELRERSNEWPKPLHDEVAFIAEDAMLNEHERAVLRRAAALLSRQDGEREADAYSPGGGERHPDPEFVVQPFRIERYGKGEYCVGLWHGKPWLLWRHPDGQWVTQCQVEVAAPPAPDAPAEPPAIGEIIALGEGEEVPEAGQVWRHYKGGLYEVVTRAVIEATMEVAVVYRAVAEPHQTFVRSLDNWLEDVDGEPRFRLESEAPEGEARTVAIVDNETPSLAERVARGINRHGGPPMTMGESGEVEGEEAVARVFGFYDDGQPSIEWTGRVEEGDVLYRHASDCPEGNELAEAAFRCGWGYAMSLVVNLAAGISVPWSDVDEAWTSLLATREPDASGEEEGGRTRITAWREGSTTDATCANCGRSKRDHWSEYRWCPSNPPADEAEL